MIGPNIRDVMMVLAVCDISFEFSWLVERIDVKTRTEAQARQTVKRQGVVDGTDQTAVDYK